MTSCTILISHYHSYQFLRACLRQIIKHSHNEIDTKIIVIDQSDNDYNFNVCVSLIKEFGDREDIFIFKTDPLYSGFGIDWVMRNMDIETEYITQLHVDAIPIHNNWLYLPIKLIEENNLSFVGQLQFYTRPTDTIYPPNPFFAMAQCFNVARTETYKEMSLEAGFTRFHNRPFSDLTFSNNDWKLWAEKDYINRGSDDDIVAFHWEDKYREHDKLGLAISGYVEPSWGRIIDSLVFHFCSCREAIGVMDKMPEKYVEYTKRINEDYSDELISELVEMAKKNKPNGSEILSRNFWNGTTKTVSPPTDELNKRIEELKNTI